MIALHLRSARAITGFTLLAGTASLIFSLAFIQALSYNPVFPILLGLFLVSLAVGFIREGFGLASALVDFKAFRGKDSLGGAGGKLGTIAFAAVIAYSGVDRLVGKLQARLIRL